MEKQITIHTDLHELSGVLHVPLCSEQERKPAVILVHGFISNKVGQHRIFVNIARQLCLAGFVVLRFDFSGCGESPGQYRDVTIIQQVEEIIRAIDVIEKHANVNVDKITLLGHSLGGAIAANVASLDQRIHQLILLSPVARPFEDIVQIVGQELYQQSLLQGVANFQGFELSKELFFSLHRVRPLDEIHTFKGDVLIIHGSGDTETIVDNAYKYQYALEKRLHGHCVVKIIKDADHGYCSPIWETKVIELMLQWLEDRVTG